MIHTFLYKQTLIHISIIQQTIKKQTIWASGPIWIIILR